MNAAGAKGSGERGAALIIVLLLVATLSFILLSITHIISAAIERSAGDRARADFYWKADAGVVLARSVLKQYLQTSPAKMTMADGVFGAPLEMEIEGGKATLMFRDATRCFNVNSLVTGGSGAYVENPAVIAQFEQLMQSIGLGAGESAKLADVIVDYIDTDSTARPQGAEDGFYTLLPTPFRTGGSLLVSISELRALDGVGPAKYRRIRPFVCAMPDTNAMAININMLREPHGELIAAMLPADPPPDLGAIKSAISAIPPGGVSDPATAPKPLDIVPGIAVISSDIEAIIRLEVNGRAVEEKLLFRVNAGAEPALIARTFGEDF